MMNKLRKSSNSEDNWYNAYISNLFHIYNFCLKYVLYGEYFMKLQRIIYIFT
jgi:hypothetical protein